MRRVLLVLFAVLLAALPAFSTVPWTPEDAARARAAFEAGERPPFPGTRFFFSGDDLADFELAAGFVASMQVSDTLDPEYGGIREAEHLLDIIQTDNTSESIWFFSRFFELTGDSSLMGNLAASWTYVLNHPAYNEEGGGDVVAGYYRIYNCGWALRAQMKYLEVFGDSSYVGYADSCAGYLNTHNLARTGTEGFYNLVNPPVLAWAAGNLYEYGVRRGNSDWIETAERRGNRVKNWADADPLVLSNEEWAMSGGAVMWGLLESYFRYHPEEESLWVAGHVAEMDTIADPGSWENAWNGWYALGMKRLEVSTGDPVWGTRHLNMTDYLRSFDTDDDGGIQAQPADTDTMDQAWVTSYLGFMGLDLLIGDPTAVAAAPSPAARAVLLGNRPNPFNPETAIFFRLSDPGRVTLDVLNTAGRRVARLLDAERGRGLHSVSWNGLDGRGAPVSSGVYFARMTADRYGETRKMLLVR
ncbi:MAG: FlgD immunoglobulin-like domain containing protein [Candidatus Eisenbacteria bacterium]